MAIAVRGAAHFGFIAVARRGAGTLVWHTDIAAAGADFNVIAFGAENLWAVMGRLSIGGGIA